VEILFVLCLQNLLEDGKENWLEVLHPGNTECQLLDRPWPLPSHCDEPSDGGKNILRSIYERAFKQDDQGRLRHANGLTAWDSWCVDVEEEPVMIWPAGEGVCTQDGMKRSFPSSHAGGFIPYTLFELGPFTTKGLVLLGFRLWLSGDTYEELVRGDSVFTVDGPETLLLRIMRKYVPRTTQPTEWLDRLAPFEEYVDVGESYDIILLQSPPCDSVLTVRESGIVKAPLQPRHRAIAKRYITANRRFCLTLQYLKDVQRLKMQTMVGGGG
jgi:hypothetical protein